MAEDFPETWAGLKYPWIRNELLVALDELTLEDLDKLWSAQASQGWCVGFDEVIHFFFDDQDFDEGGIGFSLLNEGEAQSIRELKVALGVICDDLPVGTNEQSLSHPIWPQVRRLASAAAKVLRSS